METRIKSVIQRSQEIRKAIKWDELKKVKNLYTYIIIAKLIYIVYTHTHTFFFFNDKN